MEGSISIVHQNSDTSMGSVGYLPVVVAEIDQSRLGRRGKYRAGEGSERRDTYNPVYPNPRKSCSRRYTKIEVLNTRFRYQVLQALSGVTSERQ